MAAWTEEDILKITKKLRKLHMRQSARKLGTRYAEYMRLKLPLTTTAKSSPRTLQSQDRIPQESVSSTRQTPTQNILTKGGGSPLALYPSRRF